MSYYKTTDETAITAVKEYFAGINKHLKAAGELALEVSGTGQVYRRENKFIGFYFKEKTEGFKRLFDDCYYPYSRNKALIEKIKALPKSPDINSVNKCLDFHPQIGAYKIGQGAPFYAHPYFFVWNNTLYVLVKDECKYTPPQHMIEIRGSEFLKAEENYKEEV